MLLVVVSGFMFLFFLKKMAWLCVVFFWFALGVVCCLVFVVCRSLFWCLLVVVRSLCLLFGVVLCFVSGVVCYVLLVSWFD